MVCWKDIDGYEGVYMVSDNGLVMSKERYRTGKGGSLVPVKAKILISHKSKTGYSQICLCKGNKKKLFLVLRRVAKAFIPNPSSLLCVDHINGIRTDNRIENLRWCTHKENLNFELAKKNISIANRRSKKCKEHQIELQECCKKRVVIVFPNGTIKRYGSIVETEADGFEHSHVSACCKGKLNKHRGCKCYYEKDYEVLSTTISKASE